MLYLRGGLKGRFEIGNPGPLRKDLGLSVARFNRRAYLCPLHPWEECQEELPEAGPAFFSLCSGGGTISLLSAAALPASLFTAGTGVVSKDHYRLT